MDKIHNDNVKICIFLIILFISACIILEFVLIGDDKYRRRTRVREFYCKYANFYNELVLDYPDLKIDNLEECEIVWQK